MFALEISFSDGVSQPEMIFIRRPQALIGSSDHAHVVVEDLKELNYQVRLVRELGRKFRLIVSRANGPNSPGSVEEKNYDGEAALDLGSVRFYFVALDCDMATRDTEPPDRAGVRIVRQACSTNSPLFPAVVVCGAKPMVVSFVPDQPIFIGRSRQCALRLDSADVSAKHARMGYESGEFWIEDLGSTNGTFVNQQQISGRVNVPATVPIVIGREISIMGVTSEDQILRATQTMPSSVVEGPAEVENRYPVLVSVSEVVRPARVVLSPGAAISIGRDPTSDMWLGAPHVSRKHCTIAVDDTVSRMTVTDQSTNGIGYEGGVLHRGQSFNVERRGSVLDFGSGVTVALCFSEDEERAFIASHGSSLSGQVTMLANQVKVDGNHESDQQIVDSEEDIGSERQRRSPLWRRVFDLYRSFRMGGRILMIITMVTVFAAIVIAGSLLLGAMRAGG